MPSEAEVYLKLIAAGSECVHEMGDAYQTSLQAHLCSLLSLIQSSWYDAVQLEESSTQMCPCIQGCFGMFNTVV